LPGSRVPDAHGVLLNCAPAAAGRDPASGGSPSDSSARVFLRSGRAATPRRPSLRQHAASGTRTVESSMRPSAPLFSYARWHQECYRRAANPARSCLYTPALALRRIIDLKIWIKSRLIHHSCTYVRPSIRWKEAIHLPGRFPHTTDLLSPPQQWTRPRGPTFTGWATRAGGPAADLLMKADTAGGTGWNGSSGPTPTWCATW